MRHAKSSWGDASIGDYDRPLNQRGEKASVHMAKIMVEKGIDPEAIISSPALRARQTGDAVADEAEFTAEITFDERIYEASPMRLLAVIAGIPSENGTAMLIGHNPGMEGLIWHITGTMEPMSTAALAIVDLNIDKWSDIRDNCGIVTEVLRPQKGDS